MHWDPKLWRKSLFGSDPFPRQCFILFGPLTCAPGMTLSPTCRLSSGCCSCRMGTIASVFETPGRCGEWVECPCMLSHVCMNCSPPDCSVREISQPRILEQIAILLQRIFPTQGWNPCLLWASCIAGRLFTTEPPRKLSLEFLSAPEVWCVCTFSQQHILCVPGLERGLWMSRGSENRIAHLWTLTFRFRERTSPSYTEYCIYMSSCIQVRSWFAKTEISALSGFMIRLSDIIQI